MTDMKPVIVRALKRIGTPIILIGSTVLLLAAPRIYRSGTPIPLDTEAACPSQTETGHTAVTVKDLAFDYAARPVKVKTTGLISWSPAAEAFYLRDGIFSLKLDAYGCADMGIFKRNDETPVFVKGVITVRDGEPVLWIDGISVDLPAWVKVLFSAGLILLAFSVILVIVSFFQLLGWLLIVIGIRHPKPPTPAQIEAAKDRQAGASVLCGLFAPAIWLLNPVLGAAYGGLGIHKGLQGLRSSKRTVAVVGIVMCGAGFVAMPIVLAFNSRLYEVQGRMAQTMIIESFESATGTAEVLERLPYVNEDIGISIRLPKGWTLDASGKEGPPLVANAPGADLTAGGEPLAANIFLKHGPAEGQTAAKMAESLKEKVLGLKDGAALIGKNEIEDGHGGTFHWIEANLKIAGEEIHIVDVLFEGNGDIYFVEATSLASAWNLHGPGILESLATLRVLEKNP